MKKRKKLQFGCAAVEGPGFRHAALMEDSCFSITAINVEGVLMDQGCTPLTAWRVDVVSKGAGVRMQADVTHEPSTGRHVACYRLTEPGYYSLFVVLLFVNKHDLLRSRGGGPGGFRHRLVARSSFGANLAAGGRPAPAPPACTPGLLGSSRNRGRWVENSWRPYACELPTVTPASLRRCLANKSLLMVGDSQMRWTFAELMAFLGQANSSAYEEKLERSPRSHARLNAYKIHTGTEVPYKDKEAPGGPGEGTAGGPGGPREVIQSFSRWGESTATYYGTAWNGFALASVPVDLTEQAEPPSTADDTLHRAAGEEVEEEEEGGDASSGGGGPSPSPAAAQVQVTYVAHLHINDPLFRNWTRGAPARGHEADGGAPFDYVLAASGLHDLSVNDIAEYFARGLDMKLLPDLATVVRDRAALTWTGIWAAQEKAKKHKFRPFSNNVRGFAFDDAARRVIRRWGANFLDLSHLTQARPDLCLDSTHYSWPISLATIQLWLGPICGAELPAAESAAGE